MPDIVQATGTVMLISSMAVSSAKEKLDIKIEPDINVKANRKLERPSATRERERERVSAAH
ncbi:hypothetical protein IJG89_00490 [Candidatus Saccharibacteria bacterium]|nr:hypothetical protein [Candidatus Saccharibacteria bacterium]